MSTAGRWNRMQRVARRTLAELLAGNPDGLLRIAAERLVPRLEVHRNRGWADALRRLLIAPQPGARASTARIRAALEDTTLLLPPGWRLSSRQQQRLRRRLAARRARTGAALVTCDDWVQDAGGRWIWRQKPLHDPLFDAGTGIGAGPMLLEAALARQLDSLDAPPHGPAWRRQLLQRAEAAGGHAHLPLPQLRAPSDGPAAGSPPHTLTPNPVTAKTLTPNSRPAQSLTPQSVPLVSVLIPTAGFRQTLRGRSEILVRHCLRSLLERSRHRHLEVVVIDGGELADGLVAELRELVEGQLGPDRWRLLRDSRPYDYTSRINAAAAAARGDLLLQLNDDTELLDPDGLTRLIEALQLPGVGVVGALLLYPDGRVQHAGTAIDNLAPRHAWAGCRPEDLPWGTLAAPRRFHAVTAAVSLCRRSLWQELGGLSERFPINYGDVDFCLRAAELGQITVLEPRSRWLHFESASRPIEAVPPELATFEQVWAERLGGEYSVDAYCSTWRQLLCVPTWKSRPKST